MKSKRKKIGLALLGLGVAIIASPLIGRLVNWLPSPCPDQVEIVPLTVMGAGTVIALFGIVVRWW